ncbi:hypothetical protein [Acidocella sp.]|uniref:hypothetical protein n=1 Tax=Acidocella sp. TaxID=50710 RepID=UPI002633C9F1|nr:hypothetical protein [Acidocella sp.]
MTAEVVILNKSAVAVAADSAVTIDSNGAEKIYNSVDKIFELSIKQPVGLMIYGGLEFMGIPLSTVIKLYRSKRNGQSFQKTEDYAKDFMKFLLTELPISDREKSINVFRILFSAYNEVWDEINNEWRKRLVKDPKFSRPKFNNEVLMPILEMRIEDLAIKNKANGFSSEKETKLCVVYQKEHLDALKMATGGWKLTQKASACFEKICGLALVRNHFSAFSTGMVFFGFGDDEIFPSVQSIELDGIVCGKLKISESKPVEIANLPLGAEVIPFAQHEMVDRFLDGVDPRYERYLRVGMRKAIQDFGDNLIDQHFSGTPADKVIAKRKMRSARTVLVNEFQNRAEKFKEEKFKSGILDMVRFMPKQELAHMAESLVNLTTIKRHVSAEKETVGGLIDIAVISKSEGFVWIKRKHYFDKEFNQRYFARQFGSP